MQQVTWRAADELVDRVRWSAARAGHSMNEYLSRVLSAATDPELADAESVRVRERLARAGLLVPPQAPRDRPDAERVEAAGRRAAGGTSVADIVVADRG